MDKKKGFELEANGKEIKRIKFNLYRYLGSKFLISGHKMVLPPGAGRLLSHGRFLSCFQEDKVG